MNKKVFTGKILICLLLTGFAACSLRENVLNVKDNSGILYQTDSPVSIQVKLNKRLSAAAREGRLTLSDAKIKDGNGILIPAQLELAGNEKDNQVVMILPQGAQGNLRYKLIEEEHPFNTLVKVSQDPKSHQIIVEENNKKVLQYNYQTVYEKDVIRLPDEQPVKPEFSSLSGVYLEEYLKENPVIKKDSSLTSSVYAVPRSDYIHPLYGLEGEMLTRDWPDGGHPHHRGIFWAWPEVEYGAKRGDLYALQRIFARPTGKIELTSGPVFGRIVAENLWMWEDVKPIVHEYAVITVYRASSDKRVIDLTFKLDALEDSITLATRGTNSYGSFNLRMMTPDGQEISYFTDQPGSQPLRAWSDFNGIFKGAKSASGLMVLQHKENPEYPGAWVEYPGLGWVQPTFPSKGTRYPLPKDKSLILRYRLIVHSGGKPDADISSKLWDAFNSKSAPLYGFKTTKK
jgi:hypothetical protein